MKTLFNIQALIIILLTLTFTSCQNDDNTMSSSGNKFTVQNTDYTTPNAYLILDDGPMYTNAFAFTFIDGLMREDTVNGASISTNTTQGIAIHVSFGTALVGSESTITNNITNGTNYNVSPETSAIVNLSNFTNTYTFSGQLYGDPDETGATTYEVNSLGNGSLQINTFTVDLVGRTGTIDCNYTITDENTNTINGSYTGNFEIINEF